MTMKIWTSCIVVVLIIALGCESCGYDEYVSDEITAMQIEGFDNSGKIPKPIESGLCSGQAYMLWVSFQISDYGDVAELANPMVALRFITLTDFDEAHRAGSDVTEMFDMHPIRPEISGSDYDTYIYEPVRFAMPSRQSPLAVVYKEGAYFMLMESPKDKRECRFAAEVEFSDGKILSAQCEAVTLY